MAVANGTGAVVVEEALAAQVEVLSPRHPALEALVVPVCHRTSRESPVRSLQVAVVQVVVHLTATPVRMVVLVERWEAPRLVALVAGLPRERVHRQLVPTELLTRVVVAVAEDSVLQ